MKKLPRDWYECKQCGYAIDWFDMALTSYTGKHNNEKYPATRGVCKECYARQRRIFYKHNKEYCKNKVKISQLKHVGKQEARNKVNQALKTGKLIKQPCEICGNKSVQGHHDDYSKPLLVTWLCSKHHGLIHSSFDN